MCLEAGIECNKSSFVERYVNASKLNKSFMFSNNTVDILNLTGYLKAFIDSCEN